MEYKNNSMKRVKKRSLWKHFEEQQEALKIQCYKGCKNFDLSTSATSFRGDEDSYVAKYMVTSKKGEAFDSL